MNRILLLGDQSTGKTLFLNIFLKRQPEEITLQYKPTFGIQAAARTIQFQDRSFVNIQVWDTSGQIQYRQTAEQFYAKCKLFILFIDRSEKSTFDGLNNWLQRIKQLNNIKYSKIFVIANKTHARQLFNKIDFQNKFGEYWKDHVQYFQIDIWKQRFQLEQNFIKPHFKGMWEQYIIEDDGSNRPLGFGGGSSSFCNGKGSGADSECKIM